MHWLEEDNCLKAKYVFKDFMEAFSFMTEVAFHAEKLDHHPDWTNVYNQVIFSLNTHSAGNIVTEKDYKLAAAIDEVFKKYNPDS